MACDGAAGAGAALPTAAGAAAGARWTGGEARRGAADGGGFHRCGSGLSIRGSRLAAVTPARRATLGRRLRNAARARRCAATPGAPVPRRPDRSARRCGRRRRCGVGRVVDSRRGRWSAGRWSVGRWPIGRGRWPSARAVGRRPRSVGRYRRGDGDGRWIPRHGDCRRRCRRMADGCRLTADGCRLPTVDCRLLTADWRLMTDDWRLTPDAEARPARRDWAMNGVFDGS